MNWVPPTETCTLPPAMVQQICWGVVAEVRQDPAVMNVWGVSALPCMVA
jgi:hypothetical protein